jgi:hypothetical protein
MLDTQHATHLATEHTGLSPIRVLLVEPDAFTRTVLRDRFQTVARVATCDDFWSARVGVLDGSFDFLVTNARLVTHNGLHLVYLTAAHRVSARSIVYSDRHDAGVACDVQHAGAFYETHDRLAVTLTAYLRGPLPPRDRRDPDDADRLPSSVLGAGRRSWDQHVASPTS